MESEDKTSSTAPDHANRKSYCAPQLLDYGLVTQLTASGSGTVQEQADLGQCRNSPNLSKC